MIKTTLFIFLFSINFLVFAQDSGDTTDDNPAPTPTPTPVPAPEKERFVWAKRKGTRIVVDCYSRGKVNISSFDMDLNAVEREVENGCESFEVFIIDKEDRESILLESLDLNFLVYMQDRLRRSPSDLMKLGPYGNFSRPIDGSDDPLKKVLSIFILDVPTSPAQLVLYGLGLVKTRLKNNLLMSRLVRFLELGEISKTTKINKRYMKNIPIELNIIKEDYEILTR